MAVFSRKPYGYKLGLILLFLGITFYLLGFSSPYWYTMSAGMVHVHGGLWKTCFRIVVLSVCEATRIGSAASDWMTIVQGLQSVALAGLSLAVFYGVVVNWLQPSPRYTRLLEALAFLSSILGTVGNGIFLVQTEENFDQLKELFNSVSLNSPGMHHATSWALGINLAACLICLVASVIIAVFNSPMPAEDAPAGVRYNDYETGDVYPVTDLAAREVFYLHHQPTFSSPQSVLSCTLQQPPGYQSASAPTAIGSVTADDSKI